MGSTYEALWLAFLYSCLGALALYRLKHSSNDFLYSTLESWSSKINLTRLTSKTALNGLSCIVLNFLGVFSSLLRNCQNCSKLVNCIFIILLKIKKIKGESPFAKLNQHM